MKKLNFVHLHVRSDYSIIDGIARIKSLVRKSSLLKFQSLAITDFTNLFGSIKFFVYSYNFGIKPIIGSDFLVNSSIIPNCIFHLTILAKDNIGYQNLKNLISYSYIRGYDKNIGPLIDQDWLILNNKGLIILSGAKNGDIGKSLLNNDKFYVNKCVIFYKKYFFNRFYLEIVRTGRINEEKYLCLAVSLSEKQNLPLVATNDVRFLSKEDFKAHNVRVAIYKNEVLDVNKKSFEYSNQQYIKSSDEMHKLFSDLPESLLNTIEISYRCNVFINFKKKFLPVFSQSKILDKEYLIRYSMKNLYKKLFILFPNKKKRNKKMILYKKRLFKELNIINKMGFSSYFLIVMEFIQWAKKNNIPVGPGRGSGAGSLVAYVLNITNINPIQFDLIFERFLNLERLSMPDFDIDFCMEKRDLVIEHVLKKYGKDFVSQIITFGTLTARSVIRDVGRVLGYSYKFIDKLAKLIPLDVGITLKEAFSNKQLKELYKNEEDIRSLIDISKKLEGIIRNSGKHAGGIVISPKKIINFFPVYSDEEGKNIVTQFDKYDIELIGLVKFDFLGLRTLTTINFALNLINKNRKISGLNIIDINLISLKDINCFNLLKTAQTTAIFQLESKGMKDLICRLQPDCFEDIIALIALFRPGPLQSGMVDNFINRKHRKEKIYYPDKIWHNNLLKPILKSTYGIILYQEQVMKIAQVLAGYTLGEADILRKAMSQKKIKEMFRQKKIFVKKSIKLGINKLLSSKIFDLMKKFAGYGFNKAHSTAYALISYQTLWLKLYYPTEFMISTLNSDMDNTKKIIFLVKECFRMNIKVNGPDINRSIYYFSFLKEKNILYGLGAIKGLGKITIDFIISIRNNKGKFLNLLDFCIRTYCCKINKGILEKLIFSGSFDCFNQSRFTLINILNKTIRVSNQYALLLISKQMDMFDIQSSLLKLNKIYFVDDSKLLHNISIVDKEKEAIGFDLTKYFLHQYQNELSFYCKGLNFKNIQYFNIKRKVFVAGLVSSFRLIKSKKGILFGIISLYDCFENLDIFISYKKFINYQNILKSNQIIFVYGKILKNYYNNKLKIFSYKLVELDNLRKLYVIKLILLFKKKKIFNLIIKKIYKILSNNFGNIPVLFFSKDINNIKFIKKLYNLKKFYVNVTNVLINQLQIILKKDNIKLEFK